MKAIFLVFLNASTKKKILAIGDAYNGVGACANSGTAGVPTGWDWNYYWSATKIGNFSHAYCQISKFGSKHNSRHNTWTAT